MAALAYGLLPHTLVLPHQLATEAIFVPLVVGGFAWLARAGSMRRMVAAGTLIGAASLVRPVIVLWPLVCAVFTPAPRPVRAVYLTAALAPLLAWMAILAVLTGQFSVGVSGHDLGHNLYGRAERIAQGLPAAEHPVPAPGGVHTLSLRQFAGFAWAHPGNTLRSSASDTLVLITKSGVERILLDYLNIAPAQRAGLQDSDHGWRSRAEHQGMVAALGEILRRNPLLMLGAAAGAVLFVGLMLCATMGAVAWLPSDRHAVPVRTRRLRLLLILFPLYVLATAQAVDAAQSRHRAPAEFALCLLAAAGICRRRER
jgi:hypothetical protein